MIANGYSYFEYRIAMLSCYTETPTTQLCNYRENHTFILRKSTTSKWRIEINSMLFFVALIPNNRILLIANSMKS